MPVAAFITLTTLGTGVVLLLIVVAIVWFLGWLTRHYDSVPGHTHHTPTAARRRAIQPDLPLTQPSGVRRTPGAVSTRTPTRTPSPAFTREAQ